MIELYTRHCLVLDGGRPTTLDLEQVGHEVAEACTVSGLREPWLAEQMLLALEDFFAARRAEGAPPPPRAEIDRLLVRLLGAAGYGDAAAEFARRRHLGPEAPLAVPAAAAAPWDSERVARCLATQFQLPADLLAGLIRRTLDKLTALALPAVGDGLIRELAAELLRTPQAPPPAAAGPWLLPPGFWQDACFGDARRACVTGLLLPHPVSRLLPACRVTLDLARLAAEVGTPPLTELAFWPGLERAAALLPGVLTPMREAVAQAFPGATPAAATVRLANFRGLVEDALAPLARRDVQRLTAEIPAAVQARAAAHGCPVHVTLHG